MSKSINPMRLSYQWTSPSFYKDHKTEAESEKMIQFKFFDNHQMDHQAINPKWSEKHNLAFTITSIALFTLPFAALVAIAVAHGESPDFNALVGGEDATLGLMMGASLGSCAWFVGLMVFATKALDRYGSLKQKEEYKKGFEEFKNTLNDVDGSDNEALIDFIAAKLNKTDSGDKELIKTILLGVTYSNDEDERKTEKLMMAHAIIKGWGEKGPVNLVRYFEEQAKDSDLVGGATKEFTRTRLIAERTL